MRTALLICIPLLFATAHTRAQDFALEQLEDSPRHHEWVEVTNGERTVHSFVVYPEESGPTPAVIVIHENRGLTDWVRSFADQLAGRGYLAIAPDLLSEFDEDHDRTADFENSDAARTALYQLDPEQITADLEAVMAYITGVPASSGTVAVMGFCWGGSQTFRFATNASGLAAAMVFYGSPPDSEEAVRRISAPVYGFYGGEDERINATIPETEERMNRLGKSYSYEIYEGAGHAFMRRGDDPDGSAANRRARERSWERLERILSGIQ